VVVGNQKKVKTKTTKFQSERKKLGKKKNKINILEGYIQLMFSQKTIFSSSSFCVYSFTYVNS